MTRPLRAAVLTGLLALGLALGAAPTAMADTPTTTVFASTTVESAFGADWVLPIEIRGQKPESTSTTVLSTGDGTVDVTLSGVAGTFASGLPVQPGGLAYLAQPTDRPLLAPGTYQVTATFVPAAGSPYGPSTTFANGSIVIAPIAISASAEIAYEPGSARPVITASIASADGEPTSAPAGTWTFQLSDSRDKAVFSRDVPQPHAATEPIRVEVSTDLAAGAKYTLTTTFVPVDELAPGVEVTNPTPATLTTASGSLSDALLGSAPIPLRIVAILGLLIVALAVVTVILIVKVRRQTPRAKPVDPVFEDDSEPAVDLVEMEDIGITPIRPATWSLSEDSGADADADALPSSDTETAPASEQPDGESGSKPL